MDRMGPEAEGIVKVSRRPLTAPFHGRKHLGKTLSVLSATKLSSERSSDAESTAV